MKCGGGYDTRTSSGRSAVLPDIKHLARNRWPSILEALGIDPRYLTGKHGPCPVCGGKDRFRFTDKDGDGLHICNQHGSGDGFRLLMDVYGWDFKHTVKEVSALVDTATLSTPKPQKSPEQIRADLKRVFDGCKKAVWTDPVGLYLKGRRITAMPDVLCHPGLEYYGESNAIYPCMVAVVRNPAGKPIALHRTYVYQGQKAPVETPRKGMTPVEPIRGAYIRLFQALPEMGIAEGIETACHAHQLFSMPVWSVINTTNMEGFNPPEGVTHLHIFGDNDLNFAGQRSAYILANRLSLNGLKVSVHIPPWDGHDWADMDPGLHKATEALKDFSPKVQDFTRKRA